MFSTFDIYGPQLMVPTKDLCKPRGLHCGLT